MLNKGESCWHLAWISEFLLSRSVKTSNLKRGSCYEGRVNFNAGVKCFKWEAFPRLVLRKCHCTSNGWKVISSGETPCKPTWKLLWRWMCLLWINLEKPFKRICIKRLTLKHIAQNRPIRKGVFVSNGACLLEIKKMCSLLFSLQPLDPQKQSWRFLGLMKKMHPFNQPNTLFN